MLRLFLCGFLCLNSLSLTSRLVAEEFAPLKAKRILFLGDSITHAGGYISLIEAQLIENGIKSRPEMINLGLPSETCSGLSEPDHPFPRPDVHERLDRALAKANADLVVACYGMNDGIYYPFSEERFAAYQAGMNKLIGKVQATGAKLILMTPPPFDPLPLRKKNGALRPLGADKYAWFAVYEDYDDVITKYGQWVQTLKPRVDMVIDLHAPLLRQMSEARKSDAAYTLAPDGVHPNPEGHRILARTIMDAWNIDRSQSVGPDLQKLVNQRQSLLHNAWLSHVGHKRPGVKAGLPLDEANAKAQAIAKQIANLK
ncbi:MAG: SGNH/GDSL hydrolase family protein [Planctomycetota bacterium]|jgi:lysophospholipase L1-like esterase